MEELYESIIDEDIIQMKKIVNSLKKSINIHNFRCDNIHFKNTGEIEDTGNHGLDPLMWVLWTNSSLTDFGEEISPDIVEMCKILVECHPNPNNLITQHIWRINNGSGYIKHTPYTFVKEQLFKDAFTMDQKQSLRELINYFESKIDHAARAAFKKKSSKKKSSKKKSSKTRKKKKTIKKSWLGSGIYLEFRSGSSRKFWRIVKNGTKLTTHYGKIGSLGKMTKKDYGSKVDQEYDKLIKSKKKKGYVEKIDFGDPNPKPPTKIQREYIKICTKAERSKVLNPNAISQDCEAMLDQSESELKWYTQWHKDALKKGEYDWDKYTEHNKKKKKKGSGS